SGYSVRRFTLVRFITTAEVERPVFREVPGVVDKKRGVVEIDFCASSGEPVVDSRKAAVGAGALRGIRSGAGNEHRNVAAVRIGERYAGRIAFWIGKEDVSGCRLRVAAGARGTVELVSTLQ